MDLDMADWTVHSAADPIWIDEVWLDTVVVVGLTCFILCLMGLSKVSEQVKDLKLMILHPFETVP